MTVKYPCRFWRHGLLALAVAALATGCGDSKSPTAVEDDNSPGSDLVADGDRDAVNGESGLSDGPKDSQGIAVGEPNPSAPLAEAADLVERLQAMGLEASLSEDVIESEPFPAARTLELEGQTLSVYEFDSVEALKDFARTISPDGMTIGATSMMWISSPHFFARGNLLVLYVGLEETILRHLTGTLGTPIAGASLSLPVDDDPGTPTEEPGRIYEPELFVIDTAEQLDRLLNWTDDADLVDELSAVDLTQSRVVVLFRGEMPTAGYDITIEHVGLNAQGSVTIDVSLTDPPIDALVAEVITYPVDVAVVPRDGLPSPEKAPWVATDGERFRAAYGPILVDVTPLPGDPDPVDSGGVIGDPLPVSIDVRGKVTEFERYDEVTASGVVARFLVQGELSDDTQHDRAWVEVTADTEIFRLFYDTVVDASLEELTDAATVTVRFTGPVRESYPVQAVAGQILIIP